jgi:hypothetical protein
MLGRSAGNAANKSALRAAKKAKAHESAAIKRKEKRLTATFNAAAKIVKVLTALQKANPKFEFEATKTDYGMEITTNIPLAEDDDGTIGNRKLSITIKDKNIKTGVDAYMTVPAGKIRYNNFAAFRIRKVVRIVGEHLGKRGLNA